MKDKSSKNKDSNLDKRQFLQLFMSSQKVIHNYILSMVFDKAEADDLAQETALLMWDKFDTFEPGTNFVAWGIKIAHYKVLNYLKSNKNLKYFDDELLEHISDCYQQKIGEAEGRLEALEGCLRKLNGEDRELITHYYEHGMKVTQIKDIMGCSVHVLYRAMARIHESLFCCINRTLREWHSVG